MHREQILVGEVGDNVLASWNMHMTWPVASSLGVNGLTVYLFKGIILLLFPMIPSSVSNLTSAGLGV